MSTKDTGGQAFPCINPRYDGNWNKDPINSGMTLRDWFAGQALAGLLAFPGALNGNTKKEPWAAADIAYSLADAILAERVK